MVSRSPIRRLTSPTRKVSRLRAKSPIKPRRVARSRSPITPRRGVISPTRKLTSPVIPRPPTRVPGAKSRKPTVPYKVKVAKRQKELEGMKSTKSFIPFSKVTTKQKSYLIHDNGGRPFRVVVDKKGGIQLFENNENKLFKTISKFKGYWSGFDSSIYLFHGNSIMIQLDDHNYIYVGEEVYSFKTKDVIKDYVSPVGNSDVPYPVAFGTENVYFMLDEEFVRNKDLKTKINVKNAEELYGEFYDDTARKFKMQGVKVIHKRM